MKILFFLIINNLFFNAYSAVELIELDKLSQFVKKEICGPIQMDMKPFPIASSEDTTYPNPKIPSVFVATIENANALGDNGLIIVKENFIVKDFLWDWSPIKKGNFESIEGNLSKSSLAYRDETIAVVTQEGHNNYYHWVTEILPKIILLQKEKISYDYLYLPKLKPFMRDSLKILGIPDNEIIEAESYTYVKAKQIIIPSSVSKSCYSPKWVLDSLREKFLKNLAPDNQYGDKIFISRSKANYRRFENEDALFEILHAKGFKKYFLEDLSFEEQIKLFNNAKIVFAAHGAGITNIIWCQQNVKIFEIFQEHEDDTFWYISQVMGFNHNCIKTVDFKKNGGYTNTTLSSAILEKIANEF
jgi:hypothetical protein